MGRLLVASSPEGIVSGRIVEVEAYDGANDPGSHAFRGRSSRNEVMFGPPGHLYVYFTYGMHFCANLVTDRDGKAGAVLLRAVEPISGIELMMTRRGDHPLRNLARGPARLTQAFGIARDHNGLDLNDGLVWVEGRPKLKGPLQRSGRIGLREGADLPWRFYEDGPWTSR